MKKTFLVVIGLFLTFAFLPSISFSYDVYVRGYTRQDGTYVKPHHRTSPDNSIENNYSYQRKHRSGSYGSTYDDSPSSFGLSPSVPSYDSLY